MTTMTQRRATSADDPVPIEHPRPSKRLSTPTVIATVIVGVGFSVRCLVLASLKNSLTISDKNSMTISEPGRSSLLAPRWSSYKTLLRQIGFLLTPPLPAASVATSPLPALIFSWNNSSAHLCSPAIRPVRSPSPPITSCPSPASTEVG